MSELENVLSDLAKWSAEYKAVVGTPPKPGTILRALEGNAVLTVETQEGKPPFIYGKAYVPEVTDMQPAWFLQDDTHHSFSGWKCILMAQARSELIKRCGLTGKTIAVQSLRVIKTSQSGKSLLCEIASYAE